jgi:uncharacterized protein YndB with AHSA1/START domain
MNKKRSKKKPVKKRTLKKSRRKTVKKPVRKKTVLKKKKRQVPKPRQTVIEKTILLQASPERLWNALIQPDQLSLWFSDRAECDLREGGSILFVWRAPDGSESGYKAIIRKMIHYQELILHWDSHSAFGLKTDSAKTGHEKYAVTYRIKGTPKGTQFTVIETILPAPTRKKMKMFEKSWDDAFNSLRETCEEIEV